MLSFRQFSSLSLLGRTKTARRGALNQDHRRSIIYRMSSATLPSARDASQPLSENKHLLRWVEKMAELTKPAAIHWVDGSQDEYDALCAQMVDSRHLHQAQ